ncbi:unnamed protein product, partial [Onchocerca ochengi]|uniref:F-box domain-containing protein n=1 Tax=Onchocerca ochengi TaxID=42157 RepID=A0A182EC44_ONCOC
MSHTFLSLDELGRCLAYIPAYGTARKCRTSWRHIWLGVEDWEGEVPRFLDRLPGMTDCLKGEELAFAATYISHPIR